MNQQNLEKARGVSHDGHSYHLTKINWKKKFFEVKNGGKYLNTDSLERTHAHELKDVSWVSRSDDINILPLQIGEDFKKNKMPEEGTKFVDEL